MGKMNMCFVEINALAETITANNPKIRINGTENDLDNLPKIVFAANVSKNSAGFIPLIIEVLVGNAVQARIDIQLPCPVTIPQLVLFTVPGQGLGTVTLDINITS
ncbi:hypothetical protein CWR48_17400 [Oceanobacillus arenosus]|uniref:Uncharacterized protein n=1 Tax=Oceanobacillus arenosus TaxID=1229153 RepID=A0A3D8PK23_9BACI|nr:hypothetical protein [Oceanobacillus arenosus]RDW16416.1 hypothetical protein CWR48_17400 [Oceanobacillus arenosus]